MDPHPHNEPTAPAPIPTPAPAQTPPTAPAKPLISDELEREIAEAMEELAAEQHAPQPAGQHGAATGRPAIRGPRVVRAGREHRAGKVVSVGPTDIFVEFGPKELGVASRQGWPEAELPKPNDTLEVVVDRFDAGEGLFICSRPGAVQKAEWELLEPGQVVEARVTGVNKGGLELEVAGHAAFMPASHVDVRRIEDLSMFIGQKLPCEVQRVDRSGKGQIVLSRRSLLKEERAKQAATLKEELAEGQTREGTVRKIMPFGAFVDLGGLDGLLHVSDMSYDRIHDPSKIVKEGQNITVKVLRVDLANKKIALGLKQLQQDPFQTAATEVVAGGEATGRVTKILDFGAFVEIASGVEGLVHISEISWKRIGQVKDVLREGEVVKVKVLEVDASKRRVSLSIKQTQEPPAETGRGRGKGERDGRSAEDIKKETPEFRRLREKFQKDQKLKGLSLKGGM